MAGRYDQHESIAGEIRSRSGQEQSFAFGPVHRIRIGRGKDVGGRALGNLHEQDVGRGEVEYDAAADMSSLEYLADVAKGVRQARRGGDQQFRPACRRHGGEGDQCGADHTAYRPSRREGLRHIRLYIAHAKLYRRNATQATS